jgi:hypothetical protein
MQGSMTSASKITPIGAVALTALIVLAAAVPAASASTLLSGYGGPGQGSQSILGAALLNGPSGRGGGGGSTGGGGSSAREVDLAAPTTESSGPASSRRHPASGAARGPGARAHPPSAASKNASAAYIALERSRGSRPLLGLSGSDLLYVVMGLGALALTAAVTRRLAVRQPTSKSGGSTGAAHVPTRNKG